MPEGRERAPGCDPGPMSTGEVSPTADGAQRTRALGYVRVSTREQADTGASLDAQRQAIEAECTRRGWVLETVYAEPGASGKDMKRPRLQAMLDELDAGRAEVLVAAKLDRLSRSVLDFAGLVERARAKGWALVVLDVGADTSTPAGEMLVNVMAAFAQYERRLIGQRTRDGLAVKRSQGVHLGRPATVPKDVARRIARERGRGRSWQQIADGLTADGVPTGQGAARWGRSSVQAVLARSQPRQAPST